MKKMVKCPICDERYEEECVLATVEKVVGDDIYVYCCERLEKKDKQRPRLDR